MAKDPFDKKRPRPRPINAKLETIQEKNLFSESWKHKRWLIPTSGFFEKSYRIRKENFDAFWLGGIWSKWTSPDGTEIESCCIITTEPNGLIKPLNQSMPAVVPNGYEEKWTEQVKDSNQLKDLAQSMVNWLP